ncbi:MAG TPA: FkbM family methyltransferase [Thermoleophilaceae bacterium]|nr:FkbM family methyltransferase [Thermoleophilaceae bacterium]
MSRSRRLLKYARGVARGWLVGALRAAARPLRVALVRKPRLLLERPELELQPTLEQVAAEHMLGAGRDLFFVQIGAFDGQTNDPIHDLVVEHGWHGILAEPQRRHFEALERTYSGNERVSLRNVAIARESGTRPFYRVREDPGAPPWVPQLASFDVDTILRHEFAYPRLRELIVADEVQTLSLEDLVAEAGVTRVDLFQIDAEGYDSEIVRMIDLGRWRPAIVQFEHDHLSAADHEAAMRHLAAAGYQLSVKRFDTLAYRRWPAGSGANRELAAAGSVRRSA